MKHRTWITSTALLLSVAGLGVGLTAWKKTSLAENDAASAGQPEPAESVTIALARQRSHQPTTTAIGTVLALRSVTLSNELPGTVREVRLHPGEIVEPGTVLVALDVAVEEAELKAHEAQAALAETVLARMQRLVQSRAAPEADVERALAERDVALAQIARAKAIIERKTIRAPFRARVGLADLHPGQFLEAGTVLTTLQGVDEAAHVDFAVAQHIATGLKPGDTVEVVTASNAAPIIAKIAALDARVDPRTRNATVRARIHSSVTTPAPGASVRVRVPVGPARQVVAIPTSALRKGPGGDQVFVIVDDEHGQPRAHARSVQAGATLGDEVLIQTGLEPGERVAAAGSFKLRETALVAIANAPGASAALAR